MSFLPLTQMGVVAALARGVRQCVVIGSRTLPREILQSGPDPYWQTFVVDEEPPSNALVTFVPTQFASETLATALERSHFDQGKASLFVWLGGVGYRTVEAVLASLAFMASLPRKSGVVLDYVVERTSPPSLTHTALDALASRFDMAGPRIQYLIRPPAVRAMLRSLGFQEIVDRTLEEPVGSGGHFVSAVI